MPNPEPRRSARLLILEPQGHLLLFRYVDEHRPPFWSTAGGELRPGESYREAARRELREETGFDAPIGAFLHARDATFAVARSQPARWLEEYFLVELDRQRSPDRSGWTDEERATIRDWRWWSLAAMQRTPRSFLPTRLLELAAKALSAAR